MNREIVNHEGLQTNKAPKKAKGIFHWFKLVHLHHQIELHQGFNYFIIVKDFYLAIQT